MRLRQLLTAGAAVVVALGTAVVAAPSAAAGEPIIWHQAVAVASASSPCPTTSDAEKTAGWSEWTNSWAQWPNDGKGGNVCTRSITWAYEADPVDDGTTGCTFATPYYLQFGGGWKLPRFGTPAYTDPACTIVNEGISLSHPVVYAPDGFSPDGRCMAAWGTHVAIGPVGDHVYGCSNPF